jgi:signal transduction histidine kinase/DNA-binding response OmpR family regulator
MVWTLLITDDCAEDREIYREYLSSDPHQSYQFLEAASAEVGLELCQKKHCDAILLDFCLPDMSGLEFLDELKHQGLEAPLPVIMLTGQGDERVAVQAMKRGVRDYLVKQHLEPDVLQLTVRNAIAQSHQQNQLSKTQGWQQLTATVGSADALPIALCIRQSLNLEQILKTAVTQVQQLLECDRVAIYQLCQNSEGRRLHKSVAPRLTQLCEIGLSRSPDPIPQFISFLSQNHQPSFEDVAGITTQKKGNASIFVSRDRNKTPQAYLLAPICVSDGDSSRVWGLLVASQDSDKRQWQPDAVEILNVLVGFLAIAIGQAEQLTQALAILENEKRLNAFKSQFVAMVSHEYRTPLTAILTAASTLKQHGNRLNEAKSQRFLQLIEDKARQMTQLVEDLLVIETFESRQAAFTPLPFEVLQFFCDIIEEQRQAIGDSASPDLLIHHELTFKIAGNTKGFWGDRKLLRLILVNLLSNAIKYSPDGGNVEVYLRGNDSHILFDVKDEGIGIPIEDRERLFQSFSRGSNVGTISGTGLGLAIVKACVELHRGEIAVESQPERGTTFTVRLPKRSI